MRMASKAGTALAAAVALALPAMSPAATIATGSSYGSNAYGSSTYTAPAPSSVVSQLSIGASAHGYSTYYETNSSGQIVGSYNMAATASAHCDGTVGGGDAFGRSIVAGRTTGYDFSGTTPNLSYTIGSASGSFLSGPYLYGTPLVVPTKAGDAVTLDASAVGNTYYPGYGSSAYATLGVADAPGVSASNLTAYWTALAGSANPADPIPFQVGISSLDLARPLANVGGVGLVASPYQDEVDVQGSLLVNGALAETFLFSRTWNAGDSTVSKSFSLGTDLSSFNLDLSGLALGTPANLQLSFAVIHKAYDQRGTLLGSEDLDGLTLRQSVLMAAPEISGPATSGVPTPTALVGGLPLLALGVLARRQRRRVA